MISECFPSSQAVSVCCTAEPLHLRVILFMDRVMAARDSRMKMTSEAFSSILAIKLNAWEEQFLDKLLGARAEELRHVWSVLLVMAFNIFLLWLAPGVVSVVTIATFTSVCRHLNSTSTSTQCAVNHTWHHFAVHLIVLVRNGLV